jgi:predicted ATP-dependent endonuclease of OLD family
MLHNLEEFLIHGLHGSRTISIPIINNKIILVGINGLGKTTVITLLYRLLSRQWSKLLDFKFNSLTLRFTNNSLTIKRSNITDPTNLQHLERLLPKPILHQLLSNPEEIERLTNTGRSPIEAIRYLSEKFGLPHVLAEETYFFARHSRDIAGPRHSKKLLAANKILLENVTSQVLYLPTYRRIERDLKAIFPKLEEQVRRFHKTPDASSDNARHYIELVEFGMEDVAAKFDSTINSLKETARAELNAVVGTYLREVIRGEPRSEDASTIKTLNDSTINRILNRVEERTLNKEEKHTLRTLILNVKKRPTLDFSDREAYVVRFFSKLVNLDQELSKREAAINSFASICSTYLYGKRFTYDEQNYKISLSLDSGDTLDLKDLSSGEKQIVSLFAHLYLEDKRTFAVIIDEPELSLSVDWQRKLLPDITNSGRCTFLAAATHSPYIFDNELEPYAKDLAECVEHISQ